ncbi:MAG: rhomboid family intramembrane serine protease [Lachnospiraceae bacterium]|nr:rhomboid family intramembrane serine protease [Lachnospiraceae bacterium]
MFNEISSIFNQMGYEPVELNVAEPHVNIKLVNNNLSAGNEGYVVVTLDETSGIRYTEEQFRHISQQIRSFLVHKGCTVYHFLYIFISNNSTPPFKLQDTGECLWHITPSGRQLITYGNALPMYMGLKKPIEDFLMPGSLSGNMAHNTAGNCRQYNYTTDNNVLTARANLAIVIINVIMFILSDFITPASNGLSLLDKGALSWDSVIYGHEYYRIFTCMFLHADPGHIFNNMLVLLFIGSYVEQYTGRIKYLIIYFSSGIIAGCASMVYNMLRYDYTQSVGASGAVFGLMGSLLCIILVSQHYKELGLRRVLFMILLSLYGGFTSQGVDNAAHIGGFIGGFLTTLLISGRK